MIRQAIVPAIIPDSLLHLRSRLQEVRGVVRCVQVDVMDASFTPKASWPYEGTNADAFHALNREDGSVPFWQEFEIELDLMVQDPEKHVHAWVTSGVKRIIFHVESAVSLRSAIDSCRASRVEVACAIKPSTPLTVLEPYLADMLFVQCMGSDTIGRHGVALDPILPARIQEIHARWPNMLVGIDIGVSTETIPHLYQAGARRFAAGSAVFGKGDTLGSLRALEAMCVQLERA
jgi:ribulose-phosphate 3-epimerase